MFTLVHAGNTYATRGGLAIYVRMKKRVGGYREFQTPNGTYFHLKDRVIFITKRGFNEYHMPFIAEGFDFAVNLDIANNRSAVPSPGIMFINEPIGLSYDKKMFLPRKMFLDSGGFLLLTGTKDFLDPKELAENYNKWANYGMALDIPLGNVRGQSLERAIFHAHVQRLNTNIIKKHLDDSVTLYNISHGITPEIRKAYMEVVQDKDLDHWACAGANGTPFDRMYGILTCIDAAGREKLKSLHVLGVASPTFIPALAWLGRYLDITSDASSAMRFASNYCLTEIQGMRMFSSYIGNKFEVPGRARAKGFHPRFMCSCNVCHALGSTELYQKIGKYGASAAHVEVLWVHNQHVYDEYTEGWRALAKNLPPKEYKAMYMQVLSKKDRAQVHLIDIIEDWVSSDADKACKKYTAYMMNTFGSKVAKKGEPTGFNLAAKPQEEVTQLERIDAVSRRYLEFHGDKLKKYAKHLLK